MISTIQVQQVYKTIPPCPAEATIEVEGVAGTREEAAPIEPKATEATATTTRVIHHPTVTTSSRYTDLDQQLK